MGNVELKISPKDWLYIAFIGTLFGFFIALFFYFLSPLFANYSTIAFGTLNGLNITFFSSIFITISNKYILPIINKQFWYSISFIFSFLSGSFGFLLTYTIFFSITTEITNTIEPYSLYLTLTMGVITFLIGLILHQFISMKYKNEEIKNDILYAKLKALENELNPHFLFNALNSMSELVYIDPKKAEDSILNLAQFLRNAIKTESIIELKDELDMVQTYVNIENIRFNNNIKLHVINHSDSDIKIPKFSIQLLVENGIKHGYQNKELNIYIDINKDIVVFNDGKISNDLQFGTGLKNLKKRLQLLNIGDLKIPQDGVMHFIIEVD